MNEALTIKTEQVDDIPLLLAQMQRMGLVEVLDKHFPTHGNRQGLTHVHAPADHRMNRVQSWAEHRLETLQGCSEATLEVRDLSDDRLADELRHLSDDTHCREFEQDLTGQVVRVYDLLPSSVRLDSTTASSSGAVSEDGLLQLGHSKDHRPNLPQLKVLLATLDPLGLPLTTEVLPGQRADDPLYLPTIARVRACVNKPGLLCVGDGKMGALDTRASIQAPDNSYLCPLSALQVPAERLSQQVEALRSSDQPLIKVERTQADGQTRCIAHGYEQVEAITAQLDGDCSTWTERRRLLQSLAARLSAEQALHTRLKQAQLALSNIVVRGPGKPVLSGRTAVEQAVADTLAHFRVEGLPLVTVDDEGQVQLVRAHRGRLATVRIVRPFTIAIQVQTEAARKASEHLGWRVYATNQSVEILPLMQAVEAYRDEHLVESNFGRLKGHPLSLSPTYVERDDHATGLERLLSLPLRILTRLQFVVRRHLAQQGASLAGLYVGNPKRATTQPTTERLLESFQEIFLPILVEPHQTRRHIAALSALQQHVLTFLKFFPTIYPNLCGVLQNPRINERTMSY
jgi:transposase